LTIKNAKLPNVTFYKNKIRHSDTHPAVKLKQFTVTANSLKGNALEHYMLPLNLEKKSFSTYVVRSPCNKLLKLVYF